MTIRFFILQTHYRSTLDFSNEALKASEKGLKRLLEANEAAQHFSFIAQEEAEDKKLDAKVNTLLNELEEFINDDFNTAKVVANLFEIVPVINGIKDKHISEKALGRQTLEKLQTKMNVYITDILGLKVADENRGEQLSGAIKLLIEMRKEAKAKKDYATSDRIRNELAAIGVILKDEKSGEVSYTIAS